jgi:pseudaminic acid biosynthesis-associated methylase
MTETEQVEFWRGEFGDDYIARNEADQKRHRALIAFWAKIMEHTAADPATSLLEVGPNIGNNLRALRHLSNAEFFAVEPNSGARQRLVEDEVLPPENIRDGFASSINFPTGSVDLAFTSGVMIHIHPDDLKASCAEIHRVSRRYIVCVEYFADQPEEINYRGHSERLFKRDFGTFWLEAFPDLSVVDYGFNWKQVNGLDNLNWWVFRK